MTGLRKDTRFIVVAGGVISGVGKGVATASIGKIMAEYGYKTTLIKIDPYINHDAGTLRPTEHGEVWVTEDGGEIDQDLGTYERFMDMDIPKCNSITTGQIYKSVIDRERRGEYLGQTVQFIPHITDEVINRIMAASQGYDIAVIEIGGTVGDYENTPFLFAFKAIERELGPEFVSYVLVTYLPVPSHINEMKTKPTQQAIRMLGEQGINPDFIICRSQYPLDAERKKKIEVFAHLRSDHIIAAPDLKSVYEMPLELERQDLGKKLLAHMKLPIITVPNWNAWQQRVESIAQPKRTVRVGIIGKYLETGDYSLTDSYLSILHALTHAGSEHETGVEITWINSKFFEDDTAQCADLEQYDGIIVPGGFGAAGVEGKINAIAYARTHNIPFLGLCYGLQLAAVEYARNVCGLIGAHTTEVNPQAAHPIIDILPLQKQVLQDQQYGGTMRLGSYQAHVKQDSRVHGLYKDRAAATGQKNNQKNTYGGAYMVDERHRHRYEVNPAYVAPLEAKGFVFSGTHLRADGTRLMEFGELPNHPFFVGTQAHPEFKSRFGNPNPLFYGFIGACMAHSAQKGQQKVSE